MVKNSSSSGVEGKIESGTGGTCPPPPPPPPYFLPEIKLRTGKNTKAQRK